MTSRWQKLLLARLALLARLLLVLLVSSSIIEVSGFGCGTACDVESLTLPELEPEGDQAPALRSATHVDSDQDCSCPCQCPGGCSSGCRVVAALAGAPPLPAPPLEIGAHFRAHVSRPPSGDPFGILHVPRFLAV